MTRMKLLVFALFVAAFAPGLNAHIPTVNWEREKPEILKHYRASLKIDTGSPPGNETRAAEYLRKVLEGEGIATKTFALDPNRANLVARLKGSALHGLSGPLSGQPYAKPEIT